jgi:hypothetical protein
MTDTELKKLTDRLVLRYGQASKAMSWRPKKAARVLCQEFRYLLARDDFWQELATTGERLDEHEKGARQLLESFHDLIRLESEALVRLKADDVDAKAMLTSVYAAMRLAEARDMKVNRDSVMVLRALFDGATTKICKASEGFFQHAATLVFSKKGALALAGGGVAAANLAILEPVTALASLKAALSVAKGELDGLKDLGDLF